MLPIVNVLEFFVDVAPVMEMPPLLPPYSSESIVRFCLESRYQFAPRKPYVVVS